METVSLSNIVPFLFIGVITGLILLYMLRSYSKDFIVYQYQRGLLFKEGRLTNVVEGGRYRRFGSGWSMTVVDIRPTSIVVGNQEILTKDGMAVKISNMVRYAVVDPVQATLGSQAYLEDIYQEVQIAMRDVVTNLTSDEILAQRADLAGKVEEKCSTRFELNGLKLEKIELRDVTFPGELRHAMAQVALAQKQGLAALERARGETAALRSLANAAKMLDGNPALLQLRMIQAIGEGKSGTIVLNTTDKSVSPTS